MLFPRFFLLIYNDIGDCIFACFLFVILIKYVTSTRLSRIGKAKVTCFRNESIALRLVDATKHFTINHPFIMKMINLPRSLSATWRTITSSSLLKNVAWRVMVFTSHWYAKYVYEMTIAAR